MVAFTVQNAVELLERLYPDGIETILYDESPAWGMLHKWKGFKGEGKHLVWKFANNPGASVSFAEAQANKDVDSYKRPFITRTKEYALASMDGEMLEAADGGEGSLANVFQEAMDGALYNINRSLAFNMFRNGGGARAQIDSASTVNTTVIQLTSGSSMQGLEKGMYVNAASTDGTSGSVLANKAKIIDIDREALTLTTTAAWDVLIPGIAASYYIFRAGDFGGGIKGFQAWVPDAAPTSGENFFGIDRSSDTRLYGLRYAPGVGNIDEILVDASAIAFDNGSRPDLVIMNPRDYANLVNQLGSKKQYVDARSADKAGIGYRGVMVHGSAGTLTVLADPMCQRRKAWMLTQKTWEVWMLGEVPRVLDLDGNQTLREMNADANELRVGGYLQMVCTNPNANVNITLPTAA